MTACSSSRVISSPVLMPKIDRAHLVACDNPAPIADGEPVVLWLKEFVDLYRVCANSNQVKIDYIKLLEK